MSLGVTVDDFGSDDLGNAANLSTSDQISVVDELEIVDEITVVDDDISVVDDDIEIIEDPAAESTHVAPAAVADEPPSGFQDPVMPVVVLGVITLMALLALGAVLAL